MVRSFYHRLINTILLLVAIAVGVVILAQNNNLESIKLQELNALEKEDLKTDTGSSNPAAASLWADSVPSGLLLKDLEPWVPANHTPGGTLKLLMSSDPKGFNYLIENSVKNKGRFCTTRGDKHWAYEHGIATYALAEAYMFCRVLGLNIPNLKESVQLGVQWIIDNQNPSGGWDYNFDEGGRGGDMSITAWQMQALKAGYHTRLTFRNMPQCISRALNYCDVLGQKQGYPQT